MKNISDYQNPFDAIKDFENTLCEFTGAPFAITTDCCSHAIEICLRLTYQTGTVQFPAKTYLSVPMTFHKLNIPFCMTDLDWRGSYQFVGTNIWDNARAFEANMFKPGQIQCVSFGRTKPLALGRGGCILTDNRQLYESASRMRSDGRDLFIVDHWSRQQNFNEGYHYWLRPEDCVAGLKMLNNKNFTAQIEEFYNYPDCRTITINKYKKIRIDL
jgi:dTDP-4-amino-4,6-dideoxygalactose transaminase